ncbi:MAG: polyribonucleotide nucleotidyltransferase [Patescibacteria group bacterium]|nr:polyribonucleotide nucleotidyltransferase [Patescibacteria group bacterium]
MDTKKVEMDLAGRKLVIEYGDLVSQADGCVTVSLGDTVLIANASMSDKGREDTDWFPLTVDYEENHFAAGKIKGSRFIKRAGRPSDNAILVSRMIDRPIRPLFPKGMTNETQIICSMLSADLEVEPGTTAIIGASAALMISGAPFEGPIGAVRMGYVNDELIVNPTYQQCEEGDLDLVVAGTEDAITMVESASKEVSEEILLSALDIAHKHIKEICKLQKDFASKFDVKKKEPTIIKPTEEDEKAVDAVITDDMIAGVKGTSKAEFKDGLHELEDKLIEKYADKIKAEEMDENVLKEVLLAKLEKKMRENILKNETRIDGRKLDEIRPLECRVGVLPRTHGSGLFKRGETTSLSITTLGGPGDAQIVETMDEDTTRRYMHHYEFPPYATGEIKQLRGASRRDIGHSDLAERALLPVLPDKGEFPYTTWVVSEIISCNGSSSMAAVCGSTLSLMDAGVKITRPVAGIAMGLVTDGKVFKILTDIQGLEDFAGDMDFKVTGTSQGVTALQMDIKVKGLSLDLLREALQKAKEARQKVLDKIIETIPAPREELSKYAPLITTVKINPDLIKVVIGKGGETIQKITAECEVEIDIEQDGIVTITAPDQEKGDKAIAWIEKLTYVPKVGDVFDGKVVRLMDFGAFVEITPGKDGLVHISQLAQERVNKVEDVVKLGDTLKVKLMEIDDQGRLNLSHKATLPRSGGSKPPPRKPHGPK